MEVLYAVEGDRHLEEVLDEHRRDTCRACTSPPLSSGLLMGFDLRTAAHQSEPVVDQTASGEHVHVEEVMRALARAGHGEATVDLAAGPPPGWDELVVSVVDGGLVPLSVFLAVAARTPGLSLESAVLALVRSVIRVEGRDAAHWSGSSRWVVANVTGFLSDDVACGSLPVGAFLTVQVPGIAPCLGSVLARRCACTPVGDRETFALLAREWTGSLTDLVAVSGSL